MGMRKDYNRVQPIRYLTNNDPEAYEGLTKKERRTWDSRLTPEQLVECPICRGHGGWILEAHAYGHGRHFMAACNHCNGWAWLTLTDPGVVCFPHTDRELSGNTCRARGIFHSGMFDHVYECTTCKRIKREDSSG